MWVARRLRRCYAFACVDYYVFQISIRAMLYRLRRSQGSSTAEGYDAEDFASYRARAR